MTCSSAQLRLFRAIFDFLTFRGADTVAATHRHQTDMCKELRTRVLRLLPSAGQHDGGADGAGVLGPAVEALQEGHVVALPTDTVYGLACLAQRSDAVRKIYHIKGRDAHKPLAICVGEVHQIKQFCKVHVAEQLLDDLLPGPVTLVFERTDLLNRDLNPFTSLVGVRIPDHPFMRRLCQTCGEPLALTSANVSARASSVATHEFKELWPKLAVVVDGGPMGDQSRLGSTVVDLSVLGKYRIIRPGCALPATLAVLRHKYGLSEEASGEGDV